MILEPDALAQLDSCLDSAQRQARLRAANVAQAYGFALNVSNYDPTAQEIGYAAEMDLALGMAKRFVVDTSRNGKGRASGWVPVTDAISRALPGADAGA